MYIIKLIYRDFVLFCSCSCFPTECAKNHSTLHFYTILPSLSPSKHDSCEKMWKFHELQFLRISTHVVCEILWNIILYLHVVLMYKHVHVHVYDNINDSIFVGTPPLNCPANWKEGSRHLFFLYFCYSTLDFSLWIVSYYTTWLCMYFTYIQYICTVL